MALQSSLRKDEQQQQDHNVHNYDQEQFTSNCGGWENVA